MNAGGKRLCVPAFCLFLAAVSGCADGPFSDMFVLSSPFGRDDSADDARYGPTPVDRIKVLKSLASQAEGLQPDQQQRLSEDLTQRVETEQDPLIRAEVVRALGAFPTAAAAGGLRTALADGDSDVRIAACEAWARRGGPEAITALADVLGSDTDIDVRLAATRALGQFRDPAAVRALALGLDDGNPALQYRAIESLKSLSGHDYGNDITAWREFAQGGNPAPPGPPSIAALLRGLF